MKQTNYASLLSHVVLLGGISWLAQFLPVVASAKVGHSPDSASKGGRAVIFPCFALLCVHDVVTTSLSMNNKTTRCARNGCWCGRRAGRLVVASSCLGAE